MEQNVFFINHSQQTSTVTPISLLKCTSWRTGHPILKGNQSWSCACCRHELSFVSLAWLNEAIIMLLPARTQRMFPAQLRNIFMYSGPYTNCVLHNVLTVAKQSNIAETQACELCVQASVLQNSKFCSEHAHILRLNGFYGDGRSRNGIDWGQKLIENSAQCSKFPNCLAFSLTGKWSNEDKSINGFIIIE